MRIIILFITGLLLLSCKVKLASFNPSSSEKYLRGERPRKLIPIKDTAQYPVPSDSEQVIVLNIGTAYKAGYEHSEEKIPTTKSRIHPLPVKLIQGDSVLPKQITEPAGVISGIAGGISGAGIISGVRGRTLLFFFILGGAALILGIMSLIKIRRNRKKFKGRLGPIVGIITSIPALFLIFFAIAYSCSS